jgi:hypothetical protein
MIECIECGESAKHMHPDYSCGDEGDRLCDDCMGGYIEDQLDDWIEQLSEHTKIGYVPRLTEYRVEDYADG